jgi:hypothetical protein
VNKEQRAYLLCSEVRIFVVALGHGTAFIAADVVSQPCGILAANPVFL